MSKKSHPGDGTKGQGEKGGDICFVAHSETGLAFVLGIFSSLLQLQQLLRRGKPL